MKYLLAFLLSGCSVFTAPVHEPYWKPGVYLPYAGKPDIREVVNIATYCGGLTYADGCWVVGTPIVYVRADLSPERRRCVLDHEIEGHMKLGYGHGVGAMVFDPCFRLQGR